MTEEAARPKLRRRSTVELAYSQYQQQAEGYKKSKFKPWRIQAELYTAWTMLGDVKGLSVVDLACGDGHFSRYLADLGASPVVGVDLSDAMVKLAEEQERANPKNVRYICADVSALADAFEQAAQGGEIADPALREAVRQLPPQCDVVFCGYLLNYAKRREVLVDFCRAIYKLLAPGGFIVAINNNPLDVACHHPELRKYGVTKTCEQPGVEGARIRYAFFDGDDDVEPLAAVDNYFFDWATHEAVLKEVGFSHVEHCPLQLNPAAHADFPEGYWDAMLAAQPVAGLWAEK